MSILTKYIQGVFYQYPLWSLLILGGVALLMGFFVLRQTLRWWRYFRNKREVIQQIQQHFSQNKNL